MPRLTIEGGTPLRGTVTASGAKNSALPLLAATLMMDGKTIKVNENELVFIPSKKPHAGVAITDCELIDIFSPNRTEYSNS